MLIAVYNVFDGEELLKGSIECIRPHVDKIFAVCQSKSYNGISYLGGVQKCYELQSIGLIDKVYMHNTNSEKDKRKFMLDLAINNDATHYLALDCDEYYDPKEFVKAKKEALKLEGSYCKIKTYFGSKDLTIGYDNYYVPFIHAVNKDTRMVKSYPVIVDPTRRINGNAKEVNITMHHYSWVRDNIELKVSTSSSRNVIEKSGLLEDYYNAKEGLFVKHYGKKLEKV